MFMFLNSKVASRTAVTNLHDKQNKNISNAYKTYCFKYQWTLVAFLKHLKVKR